MDAVVFFSRICKYSVIVHHDFDELVPYFVAARCAYLLEVIRAVFQLFENRCSVQALRAVQVYDITRRLFLHRHGIVPELHISAQPAEQRRLIFAVKRKLDAADGMFLAVESSRIFVKLSHVQIVAYVCRYQLYRILILELAHIAVL